MEFYLTLLITKNYLDEIILIQLISNWHMTGNIQVLYLHKTHHGMVRMPSSVRFPKKRHEKELIWSAKLHCIANLITGNSMDLVKSNRTWIREATLSLVSLVAPSQKNLHPISLHPSFITPLPRQWYHFSSVIPDRRSLPGGQI